jgi:hypothetical protein
MIPILALSLLFLPVDTSPDPWTQVRLTIARDPYTSSDQVTLCRVRAVNFGPRSFQGRDLRFEARATNGGSTVRQRGRFGLTLEPYGSLETIVALPGRHDRFEVVPLPSKNSSEREQKIRKEPSRRKSRRPTSGRRRSDR